jgi:hypothetical protein
MQDPLTRAYRYRKVSVEFSTLAKRTSSDFSRGYYQRIAEQYQTLADGELGWRHGNATTPEDKPAFSAKVWAYREQSGKKYFDEKLGSCSITAMNDLVLFDESDGLPAEQKRKLFNALGSRLDSPEALDTISRLSVT